MFHLLSKLVLKKYNPAIIGIIGKVERESTSQATFTVLSSKFSVRQNIGTIKQRNEIPLTILGLKESHSILGNLSNLFRAFSLIFLKKDYPEILIFKIPVERSKDIKFLTGLLSPYLKAIVVSSEAILSESLENFQLLVKSLTRTSLEQYPTKKEERTKGRRLSKNCQIILNYDNTMARKAIKNNRKTFGLSEASDIRAADILFQIPKTAEFSEEVHPVRNSAETSDPAARVINVRTQSLQAEEYFSNNGVKWEESDKIFISFKVIYQGKIVPIRLFGTLGVRQVYAALGAVGAGIAFGMNLLEISESLKKYRTPAGMMKIIKGIKYTLIIDNTYNADLASTSDALDVLSVTKGIRKVVVLGDMMLPLGAFQEKEHRKIGARVAKIADLLFTVGSRAKFIADGAFKAGMDKANIFEFFNQEKAGRTLQNKIKQGDIVLISGSEVMHLEQIVREIMAEPRRAKKLLARHNEND